MKREIIYGLLFAVVVAVFLSPLASTYPDGLERVLEHFGVGEKSAELINSPLPDYSVPGVSNQFATTAVAGLIGVVICFAFAYGVAVLLARQRP